MTEYKPSTGLIIAMLCLISSIGRYVLDSYLPSMPAIADYFAVSDNHVQLTISYYLWGFSISQLFYGPLSDSFGRKKTLVLGLSLFSLASFSSSFVDDNFNALLALRLLAGIGAGSCGVLNRAIASDCFKGEKFSKAWSYTTTTLFMTLILAPLLGSYVQELYDWQANFALSTLYVVIILLAVLKYLPETLSQAKRRSWHMFTTLHHYQRIIRTKTFLIPTLCYSLAFSGLIAYFQISPILFINHFGLTPIEYGYTSIIVACSYLVGGLIVNHLVDFFGPKKMLQIGLSILMASGLALWSATVLGFGNLTVALAVIFVYVIGARIVIANAIAEAFAEVHQQGGTASALIGTIQMMGAAVVSSIIAQFTAPDLLLLGECLTILGIIALVIYYWFTKKILLDSNS